MLPGHPNTETCRLVSARRTTAVVLLLGQTEQHYYKEAANNKQGQEMSPFAGFFAFVPLVMEAAIGMLSSSSSDETAGNVVSFRAILVCVLPPHN